MFGIPARLQLCMFELDGAQSWQYGMLHNVTITPNPPKSESTVRITALFRATRDIQILYGKGFLKNLDTGFKFPFRGIICDISPDFCPIAKGEVRNIDQTDYISSLWPVDTPLYLTADMFMEDDVTVVASLNVTNCSIVKRRNDPSIVKGMEDIQGLSDINNLSN